jgi:hypothetical protein
MDGSSVWSLLQPATRVWLVEHNGESLPPEIASEIRAAAGGPDASAWIDASSRDLLLTDEAVDWIEAVGNGE